MWVLGKSLSPNPLNRCAAQAATLASLCEMGYDEETAKLALLVRRACARSFGESADLAVSARTGFLGCAYLRTQPNNLVRAEAARSAGSPGIVRV